MKKTKGFTLIEIMVAISIFIIIVTVSMGSILGIFSANRKGQNQSKVMNSLNFALETMSRELRYGYNYDCGSAGNPLNCPTSGDTSMSFDTNLSGVLEHISYRLNNGAIEKSVNNGSFIRVTPPTSTLTVQTFLLFVDGTGVSLTQPRVFIYLRAYSGNAGNRSYYNLETAVSQRKLNN